MFKMKRKSPFLFIIFILTCLIVFTVNFVSINHKYPPPTYAAYTLNQPLDYDIFEIKVNQFRFLSERELKELNLASQEGKPTNTEEKVALVTLHIKNTGSEEKVLEVYPFSIESNGGFTNGINLEIFNLLNKENPTLTPTLKPGQELILYLPFNVLNIQFKKEDWKNILERKFRLVVSLYPTKKFINLN